MDLFVYGTLQDGGLRTAVSGAAGEVVAATLDGYRVRPLADSVVPLIKAASGACCEGLLWHNLSPEQAARVALYEGAFGYRLIDVEVVAEGTARQVRMWLPPEEARAGAGEWSLKDWQARHAKPSIAAAQELFAMDPRPAPQAIRRQFPMMQRRAWNRCQAGQAAPASEVRYAPAPGDWTVEMPAPPSGGFFRLQPISVTHRRFDGGTQGPLPREVFVGTDAVLVLPYDPRRDRIVLVEQIRMGVLVAGDPNPWTLEPVAGMIDAFEAPEAAALRETREEAGLEVTLVRAAAGYSSPGNATDYFHLFAGLCDLPDEMDTRWSGGLAEEHEDLRLHMLDLDNALALVERGEITALPCVTLLQWVALNRARLRLEFDAGKVR